MAQGLVIAGTYEHGLKVTVREHGGRMVRGVLPVHKLGGAEYQKAVRAKILFYGFTGTCLCLVGPGGKCPGVRNLPVTDRQVDACRGDKEQHKGREKCSQSLHVSYACLSLVSIWILQD